MAAQLDEKTGKEITVHHKVESPAESEETRTGPVFMPAVDIFESDEALTVMADMPGVEPDGVDIDLENDILTINAEVKPLQTAGETDLALEYETGRYHRQFRLGQVIDKDKIEAKLALGVLTLSLPKIGPAQPRKIQVSAA